MKPVKSFRRALCAMLIAATLLMSAVPAFAASATQNGSYVVTASRLNVHSTASRFNVIGKLKRGTVVVYKSSKNGWWYVKYDGGEGYVDKNYLSTATSDTKYSTTANLRVRSKASTTGAVLGKLKKGTKVTVLKKSGTWAQIGYNGRTGWVATKYLKKAN